MDIRAPGSATCGGDLATVSCPLPEDCRLQSCRFAACRLGSWRLTVLQACRLRLGGLGWIGVIARWEVLVGLEDWKD